MMFMHDGMPIACWIEISGWDVAQNFFVEKSTLEWLERGTRRVCVRTPLRPGAMIFARALDNYSCNPSFPVAYMVESVSSPDPAGFREMILDQLRPRHGGCHDSVAAMDSFASNDCASLIIH
jgi:hypothetical protein